ncbi:MAG: hypothetical protein VB120_07620 [Lachnospiraceae bacterium]|nr:hypothetical protein [Lachnospiraceae bacterium]
MICPNCKTEMRIESKKTVITGDTALDEKTKVYTVFSVACVNPACADYGKKTEVSNLIYESGDI